MRLLSEFTFLDMKIQRDCDFATLGFIEDPRPDMLVFIESQRFLSLLKKTPQVRCVVTTRELSRQLDSVRGLAVSNTPRKTFIELHNYLAALQFYWLDFPTEVHETAQVHPTAYVAEKNIRIGPHSVIQPHATLLERTIIGASVLVCAGAVLGSTGLQSSRLLHGVLDMVHAGGIVVKDNVHVLSHASIADALFHQSTTLAEGVRIGSHAFVSHNVQIGERTFLGHGAVVNGNVTIGEEVWIGPGAVISNNIRVGSRAHVSLGSTVVRDVAAAKRVSGNFAMEHREFLRRLATRT
ncbi:MAG: hypothetical protein HY645_11275 [Acidobacteria bacterium]|nr:hypothetical protein [Acidobacteriota bacterium]